MRELVATGYEGRPLPCILHEAGGERRVALVLPGAARSGGRLGGTPARPDLHFTAAVLQSLGFAVLEVWSDVDGAPEDREDLWLEQSARGAIGAIPPDYELGLLVGRSFGTRALALLYRDRSFSATPSIWVAPLLVEVAVAEALQELEAPALVIGGTKDALFDSTVVDRLRAAGRNVLLLDGRITDSRRTLRSRRFACSNGW
jgi:hypothetical protein